MTITDPIPTTITADQTPESVGWWVNRLLRRLAADTPTYDQLDAYYHNTAAVPVGTSKEVKRAYQQLMRMAHTNYAQLVVDAVRERMMPGGFRIGDSDDPGGDAEGWRIWQANHLDADCDLVHTAQLAMGAAYVIVGPAPDDQDAPLITPEDPRQVVVEYEPGRRRRVAAALKLFRDDVAEVDRLFLYLPGEVVQATRERKTSVDEERVPATATGWTVEAVQQLPIASVPVVPFLNKADMVNRTTSELQDHLGLLNRINFTVLQRLEIATLQAFRQRALKGVPPTDEHGNEIDYDDIFANDPAALWILPETAEIWESGQVDLGPIRQAVRDDVQDLAATTRTPLYYLTPDAANGSAEGAALAREGLVFKCWDRIRQAGEAWEQVLRLAFAFDGDTERASAQRTEIMWLSPERYSLNERADAASKALAGGVPWHTVMTDIWQFSPQKVDQMDAQRAGEAMLTQLAEGPAGAAMLDGDELRKKADAFGALIRAGVTPASAASAVGLAGLDFLDAVPITLRSTAEQAAQEAKAAEQLAGTGAD